MSFSIDDLPRILMQYSEDVRMDVEAEAQKVARQAASRLRRTSPKKRKNGGKYAKGWAVRRDGSKYVVYGKYGTYQLAHLLEHGHAKRNGGRTAAKVHIKPVEDWATAEFEKRVKEVIR